MMSDVVRFTPVEDRHSLVIRGISEGLISAPRDRRKAMLDGIDGAASLIYQDRLRLPTEVEADDVIALDLALSVRYEATR